MPPKKKYYAVKVGRKIGIFNTWDECKRQVMGYPSAVYKSFTLLDDAQTFLQGATAVTSGEKRPDDERVRIYVDGSYDNHTKRFSYGMVVISQGREVTDCKAFDEPSLAAMRNVAGEIKGSMAAMRYCIEHEIDDVIIYYDYEGISKWVLGEWKATKDGTKAYVQYFNSVKDRLSVEFRHVKGHSGDKYNDMVDALAKSALGLL